MMNLQEVCINAIVDEFDRYFLAFSTTDDLNLKRKFEFLQRVYSYQIVSQLYDVDKLEENHLDLLLNRYLKTLHTEWFKNSPWETIATKIAEIGPTLQKIYIHEWTPENFPWHEIIPHLRNLEMFTFQNACNDEILKYISDFCPNIMEIDVSNSYDVTGTGIMHLCKKENGNPVCPKLKKLLCSFTSISDEGMKCVVQNIQSLEMTDYRYLPKILYTLHEEDMSALHSIQPYNFTSLNLSVSNMYQLPHYTSILKVCFSVCPHLKCLFFSVSNSEHLDVLSTAPFELEELNLDCFSDTEIDINDLLKLKGKKLTSLTLSRGTLSICTLPVYCPSLKQLRLTQACFQHDDDATDLFRCLESCTFDNIAYNLTSAKAISLLLKYSPKLEELSIKRTDLSSSEIKADILSCCENFPVKIIRFSHTAINVEFLKDILLNSHFLKSIYVDDCNLNNDEELELFKLTQLLPNCPDINFNDMFNSMTFSDYEDGLTNSSYDFDDYVGDEYDDYAGYDYEDYEEEEDIDDDYGYYFEL